MADPSTDADTGADTDTDTDTDTSIDAGGGPVGRGRIALGAVGVVLIGFGAVYVLLHLLGRVPLLVLWLALPLAVHDGLLVPLTLALAWAGRRVLPRAAWGPVVVGFTVTGTLLVLALPPLLSPATGEVPGLLNRNYAAGLAVSLALTWLVVGVMAGWQVIRHRRAGTG